MGFFGSLKSKVRLLAAIFKAIFLTVVWIIGGGIVAFLGIYIAWYQLQTTDLSLQRILIVVGLIIIFIGVLMMYRGYNKYTHSVILKKNRDNA